MKHKNDPKKLSSARVILRIMKDSSRIIHWLALATLLSIGSAYLAMTAPELLGNLTNQIYDLLDAGISIDTALFHSRVITLAAV